MGEKNELPSRCGNPESCPQSALLGTKIGAIARNVNGTIEINPRTVANIAPSRIPSHAGMNTIRMPAMAIPSVHHAMNVCMGVNPAERSSPNSDAM